MKWPIWNASKFSIFLEHESQFFFLCCFIFSLMNALVQSILTLVDQGRFRLVISSSINLLFFWRVKTFFKASLTWQNDALPQSLSSEKYPDTDEAPLIRLGLTLPIRDRSRPKLLAPLSRVTQWKKKKPTK